MDKMIYSIIYLRGNPEKLNSLLVGMKGISGSNLYTVSFAETTAIVTDIERDNVVGDRSNAIDYAGVIETLAQQFTLLPMRFGSVLESTHTIKMMLGINYNEIVKNLGKVENKFEFGLKVFCDSWKLKSELKAKSEVFTKPSSKPDTECKNSVYRDYVNKKLKEHKLEELLLSYVNSVIAEITACLDRLKVVNKFKKMTDATTIIDAVFLLEKDKKTELIKAVGDLQHLFPGLNFVLTGPWPPYNFVEIAIK